MGGRPMGRRVVTCALAAALGVLALPVEGAAARQQSAYIRVAVSPECTIYGLVWDNTLFLGDDAGELADADPVEAEDVQSTTFEAGGRMVMQRFPVAVLPVPPEALPQGTTEAVVSLQRNLITYADPARARETVSVMYGLAGWGAKDGEGRQWRYWRRVWTESGARPEAAPMIELPPAGPLALKPSTKAMEEERTVGIGVRLMAQEAELGQVTRAGENALVRLRVLDGRGEEVSAADGDLEKFGFT